jgi:hypothetical protein
MIRFLSILLIAALFAPLVKQTSVLVNFELNREFIAKVFCIKKEEPITVCGGHCYLMNELGEINDSDSGTTPNKTNLKPVPLFFQKPSVVTIPVHVRMGSENNAYYTLPQSLVPLFDIFHPPREHDQTC